MRDSPSIHCTSHDDFRYPRHHPPLQAADWPAVWPILRTTFQAGDTYAFAPDSSEAEIHKAWVELPAATFVALGAGGEALGAKNVFTIVSAAPKRS